MNNLSSKPLMLVLSSPSGAGKTTLSKKIQQSESTFKISVSHTTRKARPNEVDGVDYHFVTNRARISRDLGVLRPDFLFILVIQI